MRKRAIKPQRHLPLIYQVTLFPLLYILLLVGSMGVIYSNDRAYSYATQDETHEVILKNINSTFQSINLSIATFFANPTFQTDALSYLEGEPMQAELSEHLEFFISSNAMFSPGLVYIPIDQTSTEVSKDLSIAVDFDHTLRDFNFAALVSSANERLTGRAGSIFYQEITYGLLQTETPYFALGKNIISNLTETDSYYERIGIVYVIFHKSLINNFLNAANQVDGLKAIVYNGEEMLFASAEDVSYAMISDPAYRHRSSNLSVGNWRMNVMFLKRQVLTNISQTIWIMSAISLFTLAGYLFIVLKGHKKYMAALTYLFDSFSDIKNHNASSLNIPLTNDLEVDNVIESYNTMVQNVILLNEKVIEEQNKTLTLKVENINYSLTSLYSQINKHFIINVLAIIRSLVTLEEYKKVGPVIENFSNFLRYSLTLERYSTFQDEIKNAMNYLNIQSIRFPHFSSHYHVNHELDQIKLPKVVLQPILENCFIHGVKNRKSQIDIYTYKKDIFAVIEVINDNDETVDKERILLINKQFEEAVDFEKYQAVEPTKTSHNIALLNILKRLKIDDARSKLSIWVDDDNRTHVAIYIPLIGDEKNA